VTTTVSWQFAFSSLSFLSLSSVSCSSSLFTASAGEVAAGDSEEGVCGSSVAVCFKPKDSLSLCPIIFALTKSAIPFDFFGVAAAVGSPEVSGSLVPEELTEGAVAVGSGSVLEISSEICERVPPEGEVAAAAEDWVTGNSAE
jgi:hypothetical protein